jgi:acetylornithine deacetylase/succinyl-diaminopimelate desuccinylase
VNGHLDVVPVDRSLWEHDPFAGDFDEGSGRLFGRGTADMKGGIAAAIEALHLLSRLGIEPACDLVFHLVADEERGSALGTAVLVREGLVRGDGCVVPEPTGMGVSVAELGVLHARIVTHGRSVHGSLPSAGESAVVEAARFALTLHDADFGEVPHPLLGRATANVGVIEGGRAHNIVPDSCELRVDRRVAPGRTRADAEADLRRLIDPLASRPYDLEVVSFSEPSEMAPDHPLALLMAAAAGPRTPIIGARLASDARFVRNQAGVPAVVCGPGSVAQAHTVDEHITADELAAGVVAFARLFAAFGSSGLSGP